jgi:hypothetical protein
MARGRFSKIVEIRSKSGNDVRTVVASLAELRPDRAPPALTFTDGNQPILRAPPNGWKVGMEDLIVRGRCPYCRHRVLNIDVGEWGLAWSCVEGCNP